MDTVLCKDVRKWPLIRLTLYPTWSRARRWRDVRTFSDCVMGSVELSPISLVLRCVSTKTRKTPAGKVRLTDSRIEYGYKSLSRWTNFDASTRLIASNRKRYIAYWRLQCAGWLCALRTARRRYKPTDWIPIPLLYSRSWYNTSWMLRCTACSTAAQAPFCRNEVHNAYQPWLPKADT